MIFSKSARSIIRHRYSLGQHLHSQQADSAIFSALFEEIFKEILYIMNILCKNLRKSSPNFCFSEKIADTAVSER